MQFECAPNAISPFYYYKFYIKNINPPIDIADTQEEWPWAAYAINTSSPANLWTIPNHLGSGEQPWKISNFTVEFNNNIICCQGYSGMQNVHNVSLLSAMTMICYRLNVQCKCTYT